MIEADDLSQLDAQQLREQTAALQAEIRAYQELIAKQKQELRYRQAKIDQLTHELAIHKRWKFGKRSAQLTPVQASLLDETIDADLEAIEAELEALLPSTESEPKNKPKRQALPPQLPRTDIHHEPESESCTCGCVLKRIGEDVSEKLAYTPGTFMVERHIRGKWVCDQCETLDQAPVPPHVIDKGIPSAGLLAHTLVSKFGDHLPLYRQERIYARAGLAIPQSTLGAWVSQRMIAYYESPQAAPPANLLPAIATALGVSIDELFGRSGKRRLVKQDGDSRLRRRLLAIEKLDPAEKRQVLQLIDAFIERGQLKRKVERSVA